MPATRTAMINIAPQLPPTAQTGHVLPGLSTGSLISIGHLCDNDCTAIFSKYHVHIIKDGSLIIKGPRNKSNGLWTIPIAPTSSPLTNPANLPPHLACSAINVTSTKSDLAAFLRGTVFSPTLSTFLRAIKQGHFTTWPGLTHNLISKFLPKSMATSKGHLRRQQLHIQSTSIPLTTSLDVAPTPEPGNPTTHAAFTTIVDTKESGRSYSDQTGQSPVISSKGNKYVFVLYDYDSNANLASHPTATVAPSVTLGSHPSNSSNPTAMPNDSISSTTSAPTPSKPPSPSITSTSNVSLLMTTVATPPNAPSKPGKTTSSPASLHATLPFPSPNGTASFPNATSPSTTYAPLAVNPSFQPTPASLTTSTSTERHLLSPVLKF